MHFSPFYSTTFALRVKGSAILFITWRTDIPIKTKWKCALTISQIYVQKTTHRATSALPRARACENVWGREKELVNQGSWGMLHYLQTLIVPVQISKQEPVVMRRQGQALGVVLVEFVTVTGSSLPSHKFSLRYKPGTNLCPHCRQKGLNYH